MALAIDISKLQEGAYYMSTNFYPIQIFGKLVTPELWEKVATLEIRECMRILYKENFFDNIPYDPNEDLFVKMGRLGFEWELTLTNRQDVDLELKQRIDQKALKIRLKHKREMDVTKDVSDLKDLLDEEKLLATMSTSEYEIK